ncbi:MAG: MBL fold metallo-hydrolase [Nannocystaceae bacterium]
MAAPTLTFLGATQTVTGSKYLLEHQDTKVLVDCGLFQGFKPLRLRNWAGPPVSPSSLDAVVLTHAHLDHSGYLPVMVREGMRARVHCSAGTVDLCEILLPDSGRLHELDAEYANRRGFSRHRPARPLYTEADAEAALERLKPVSFDEDHKLAGAMRMRLRRAGHIVGAASVRIDLGRGAILFSGDLGRPNDPLMRPPAPREASEYLVVESTYGDRRHDPTPPEDALAEVINRTIARGGSVVIPSFAVGRTQSILLLVDRLKQERRIADVPVFMDSPMAIAATAIYQRHADDHRLSPAECDRLGRACGIVREAEDSKALDQREGPMILISASGMATGGRVVHHLKKFAPDPRNTVLFAGFQAGGTRGAAMIGGAATIKIHGQQVPVEAEVASLDMLSAHADADEILAWLRTCEVAPKHTFVTHGEANAADALRRRIQDELGWSASAPEHRDRVELA